MNIPNHFTCKISPSNETKSSKKKPTRVETISKNKTEQVLRLILQLSLLIRFRVFSVDAHALSTTAQPIKCLKICWFLLTLLNRYTDLPVAEN